MRMTFAVVQVSSPSGTGSANLARRVGLLLPLLSASSSRLSSYSGPKVRLKGKATIAAKWPSGRASARVRAIEGLVFSHTADSIKRTKGAAYARLLIGGKESRQSSVVPRSWLSEKVEVTVVLTNPLFKFAGLPMFAVFLTGYVRYAMRPGTRKLRLEDAAIGMDLMITSMVTLLGAMAERVAIIDSATEYLHKRYVSQNLGNAGQALKQLDDTLHSGPWSEEVIVAIVLGMAILVMTTFVHDHGYRGKGRANGWNRLSAVRGVLIPDFIGAGTLLGVIWLVTL
jgi:hypothetical protein